MADILELTRLLEQQPDDHERRWHLAKKLYKIGEYRVALKHLQYLKENWTPRLNVARYLAASYYRLGRYDDAITQLQDSLREWPNEIPLREQLARVFDVTGREDKAAEAWNEILALKPENTTAKQALARSKSKARGSVAPKEIPSLKDAEMGIGMESGLVCPNCGTHNTDEFERCWKCHTVLAINAPAPRTARPEKKTTRTAQRSQASVWPPVAIGALVLLLAFAGYLSVKQYLLIRNSLGGPAPATMYAMLQSELFLTRVILGVVLLLAWPLALWMAATFQRFYDISVSALLVTGLLLAAVCFLVLWLPLQYVLYAFILLLLLSVVPLLFFFGLQVSGALTMWGIQAVVIICVACVCIGVREGPRALSDLPTAIRFAQKHDVGTTVKLGTFPIPVDCTIQWESSGSDWLDPLISQVVFRLESDGAPGPFQVELQEEPEQAGVRGKQVFYEPNAQTPFTFLPASRKINPGKQYHLLVTGSSALMTVKVTGVLVARTP